MGMLEDLIAQLDALDGREVTVTQKAPRSTPSPRDIDRIHEGLLRKQRESGSLGLNQ